MKIDISMLFYFICILNHSISSKCITGSLAANSTYCHLQTSKEDYCCYLYPRENNLTQGLCYNMNIPKFNGAVSINYNQISYSIDCGFGTDRYILDINDNKIEHCLEVNPESKEVCQLNSTVTNSCCFFQKKDISGCYWLGSKFSGISTTNDVTLVCSQFRLSTNFIILIFSIYLLN